LTDQPLKLQLQVYRQDRIAALLKEIIVDRNIFNLEAFSPQLQQLILPNRIRRRGFPAMSHFEFSPGSSVARFDYPGAAKISTKCDVEL